MKEKINYLERLLKPGVSLIRLKYILKKEGNHFQLFPYYWELLPIRLEKAMVRNNIETIIHKKDDSRLR
jgi:hypothetical protein